jgi:hypothetical protein
VPESSLGLFLLFREASEFDHPQKGVEGGHLAGVLTGLHDAAAGDLRSVGKIASEANQAVEVLGIEFYTAFKRPAQFTGQHRLLHERHFRDALAVRMTKLREASGLIRVRGGHPFGECDRLLGAFLGKAEPAEEAQRGRVGFGGGIKWG